MFGECKAWVPWKHITADCAQIHWGATLLEPGWSHENTGHTAQCSSVKCWRLCLVKDYQYSSACSTGPRTHSPAEIDISGNSWANSSTASTTSVSICPCFPPLGGPALPSSFIANQHVDRRLLCFTSAFVFLTEMEDFGLGRQSWVPCSDRGNSYVLFLWWGPLSLCVCFDGRPSLILRKCFPFSAACPSAKAQNNDYYLRPMVPKFDSRINQSPLYTRGWLVFLSRSRVSSKATF